MKKKNLWIIALVAIITIGIFGCGGDDTTTETFTVTFHGRGLNYPAAIFFDKEPQFVKGTAVGENVINDNIIAS
ncbi:hypothetical protein R84B8_01181 [Treponema sp. R8-4-B8]